jgi:hypothetical protein
MKKVVFALAVVLLGSQAWALDVWCTVDGCDVTVKFSGADGPPRLRGMALDISVSAGKIVDVVCLSADYGYQIYPGSISVDSSGNVTEWGSCKCDGSYPGTLDDVNAMTIEMASAYEAGVDPDPCDAGNMVSFRVSDGCPAWLAAVTIMVNEIRGGVVDEDVGTVIPYITECNVPFGCGECMKTSHPDYGEWDAVHKPDCWCYARQCKGDADGLQQFGLFWVYSNDLTVLKNAFAQGGVTTEPGICADYAHDIQFGLFRVYSSDLSILRTYFAQTPVPCCDDDEDCDLTLDTKFNYWLTP